MEAGESDVTSEEGHVREKRGHFVQSSEGYPGAAESRALIGQGNLLVTLVVGPVNPN